MNKKSVIYSCATFTFALLLTACNQTTPPVSHASSKEVRTTSSKEHLFKNGLRVEVLPVEQSDTDRILDIKKWKFKVHLSEPYKFMECQLHVRRKGKIIASLGGLAFQPVASDEAETTSELLIGLHPLDDSWTKSEQCKSVIFNNGGGSSSLYPNPFKNHSFGSGEATLQADGSFLLLVGSKNQGTVWPREKENDLALVLTLKAEKRRVPEPV